jgi:hypothetical protein
MLRVVVVQTILGSCAICLVLAGLLVLTGHTREGGGLLFGTAVGVCNEVMLANRVARIGKFGSPQETAIMMRAGTFMRFLMIGLAAVMAIKLQAKLSFGAVVVGIVFPIVVANVVGARYLLRPDLYGED